VRVRTGWLTALGAALVITTGCSGKAPASEGIHGKSFATGNGAVALIPSAQRQAAPPLQGENLSGQPVRRGDYVGKVVVVNFWASWCAPCVAETQTLAVLARRDLGDGVRFLGVDFRNDDRGNAIALERRFSVPYQSLYDPTSAMVVRFPNGTRPTAVPTTLVLDRQHRVAAVIYGGPVLYTTLDRVIQGVVRETA
jgi:thiol-disulfide isomerase/thioredoxin